MITVIKIWLATQLDRLKIKNQIAYGILSAIIVALNLAVTDADILAIITDLLGGELPGWFARLIQFISVVTAALLGARTSEMKAQGKALRAASKEERKAARSARRAEKKAQR